ncbi:MAG TPA: phosphatase PAP2 family protein [Lachnospiraceae bacterium]|nr:phosphatase PAP2 family protein [Lachnospiraceae bacterium]
MLKNLMNLDGDILLFIQQYIRTSILTPFFQFITTLGDNGAIWIILTIILLCMKRTRKVGILSIIALLCALLIDNILLKNIVARIRPYEVIENLHILIARQSDYSFPSGHTGSSFAAAVVFLQALPKKVGIPTIILALLIGISRLYVGVHYPSDVICGALIGIAIGVTVYRVSLYIDRSKA